MERPASNEPQPISVTDELVGDGLLQAEDTDSSGLMVERSPYFQPGHKQEGHRRRASSQQKDAVCPRQVSLIVSASATCASDFRAITEATTDKEKGESTLFEFVDCTDSANTTSAKTVEYSRVRRAARFYAHARAAFRIPADNEDTVLQAEVEGIGGELCLVRGDERDFRDLIERVETWWETKVEEAGDERRGKGQAGRRCKVVVKLL